MSTATVGSRNARAAAPADDEGSTLIFWIIVFGVLALIGFLIAWLGGWIRFTTDPRVTEILALQRQAETAFTANGGPSTVAEAAAAFTAMGEIRQRIEALPEHLRPQVERAGGSMMRQAFAARIDAYFEAPPAKREAELDRQIDQEEMMRKASEVGSAVASAVGGGGQGAAGRQGGGGGAGGGGPPRGGSSQDDRNRWRKQMIDRTTPEERARYAEYRRAMEKRREERGLPAGGPR